MMRMKLFMLLFVTMYISYARKEDGSQPRSDQDRQIILTGPCMACLNRFCETRVSALPSTNRYCCENEVRSFINNEISCKRFTKRGPQAVQRCYTHKSDWNICVNLVMSDVCQECTNWDSNLNESETQNKLDDLFNIQDGTELNYYGEDLNLYTSHGLIVRPPPTSRNPSTSPIPTVRNHSCSQDPICNRHGISDIIHYGDYVMPKHIEKELQMISLEGYNQAFNSSLFNPICDNSTHSECVVQLSQLDLRLRNCKQDEDCGETFVSMLDLAEAYNRKINSTYVWP